MLKKIFFFLPILFALGLWGFFYSYEKNNFDPNPQYSCVSYAPYDLEQKEMYSKEDIERDLKVVKKISNCVRVYSVTNGLEQVPSIAESLGMEVILGAWLDQYSDKNRQELLNLISLAKSHTNIKYVVVGNEVIMMNRVTPEYLIEALDEVQKFVTQPVTTAEVSGNWISHAEIIDHVDFIGLHDFPYWSGIGWKESIPFLESFILDVKEVTNKEIVMLEFGWPTNGVKEGDAVPGVVAQRNYLNTTIAYLNAHSIFYNVIESIDVPTKLNTTEGLSGIHWGIMTHEGKSKHIFPIEMLIIAIVLYLFLYGIVYYYNRPVLKIFATQIKSTEYIYILTAGLTSLILVKFYMLYTSVMPVFQICFTLLVIYGYFESIHKYIQFRYAKLSREYAIAQNTSVYNPEDFVSIFVASKNESAEQMIRTLNSLIAQSHTKIEILYVDNNSKDNESFKKVEKYFATNPSKSIRLFYEEKIEGYKAGALNYLLTRVSPESKYIAVVDSDYVVQPKWIETALTYMEAKTGFVQFPQAYSISEESYAKKHIIEIGSTIEQRYVFDIVYPVRSLLGDVVQNGTMVLINRSYVGNGWPTYSICEDAALGLEISAKGGVSKYVPTVMGEGSNLQSFANLRKQRNRWVFGAMQIIQRGLLKPQTLVQKTFVLFCIDWLGWIMHGLYPILLVSSLGYVCFLWLVYLHTIINWVMIVGFLFVLVSLVLFILTYIRTYAKSKRKLLEIISILTIEFALVNTITKSVLSALIQYKAMFVTTRQNAKVKLFDLLSLSLSTVIIWFGIFLYIILLTLDIPVEVKLVGVAQLSVVLFPQFAYMWLRFKY